MRRLTVRELIGCTVFGVILGLTVRPRHARISADVISREELGQIGLAVMAGVAVSFGVYFWLVRRDRN